MKRARIIVKKEFQWNLRVISQSKFEDAKYNLEYKISRLRRIGFKDSLKIEVAVEFFVRAGDKA